MSEHPPITPRQLYVLDDTGVAWRVHDVVFARGTLCRVALGARAVNARVFVNEARVRRLVMLEGARGLDDATLRTQLRNAGYLPTSVFVPITDPR